MMLFPGAVLVALTAMVGEAIALEQSTITPNPLASLSASNFSPAPISFAPTQPDARASVQK
jgi:hypothetical protein